MKLVPMRFMGYTWHHNPKNLEISSEKKVASLSVPYNEDIMQYFGEKGVTISGTGELYGSDCLEQYKRLHDIYKKGECAVLCLPQLSAVYACFESLDLIADDKKDVVTYKFVFKTKKQSAKKPCIKKSVVANKGDTLWDISCRYSVDIDTLIKLNSDIMFINDIEAGKQVVLC